MDIREKIRQEATPYRQEGETIVATFVAFFPGRFNMRPSFNVASTNRRILVFVVSGWRSQTWTLKGTLPRSTRFGPTHSFQYPVPALEGRYVSRSFYKDVDASDAAIPK
jgi:hypothetical protein